MLQQARWAAGGRAGGRAWSAVCHMHMHVGAAEVGRCCRRGGGSGGAAGPASLPLSQLRGLPIRAGQGSRCSLAGCIWTGRKSG